MSGWIKIGFEFIKALPGQWKGSSDPNAPSEIVNTMAEEEPRADSVAVGDESQIGVTAEASANQQEIERRREIVRQFFKMPRRRLSSQPQDRWSHHGGGISHRKARH